MKVKLIYTLVLVLFLVGCGTKNTSNEKMGSVEVNDKDTLTIYSYADKIDEEKVNSGYVGVELANEYTPSYMYDESDLIVIGTILTIDNSEIKPTDIVGFTNGTLLVNNILMDEGFGIKENDILDFSKPGVILPYDKWAASQPTEANNKREYLNKVNGDGTDLSDTYIDMLMEGDIHIEAGKTYLIYLSRFENSTRYEIIGLGNGLRELNIPRKSAMSRSINNSVDLKNVSIKDNETETFESLQNYIDIYISKDKK